MTYDAAHEPDKRTPDSTSLSQPLADAGQPGVLAEALESALRAEADAAGRLSVPVSLSLDYVTLPEGPVALELEARIDRSTRSLLFASAEARSGGALVATASAVFRVREG